MAADRQDNGPGAEVDPSDHSRAVRKGDQPPDNATMTSREESSRIGAEGEAPALRDAQRAMRPPYGAILWAVILVIGVAIILSIIL